MLFLMFGVFETTAEGRILLLSLAVLAVLCALIFVSWRRFGRSIRNLYTNTAADASQKVGGKYV